MLFKLRLHATKHRFGTSYFVAFDLISPVLELVELTSNAKINYYRQENR
jgi:hypothetical protein